MDFEIDHFHNFWTSVTLILDRVIHCVSFTDLNKNWVEIGKLFWGRMDIGAGTV